MGLEFKDDSYLTGTALPSSVQELVFHKENEVFGVLDSKDMKSKKQTNSWQHLKTIEDWKKEFDSHSEWRGLSTSNMKKDLAGFYAAFSKWADKSSKSNKQFKLNLIQQIFPRRQKSWIHLKTIEDWKKEFDSHPEWKGLNTKQIENDIDGGGPGILQAFRAWQKRIFPNNPDKRSELTEKIFPPIQRDWSQFQTIEDWKKEFDNHPEWSGFTITDIKKQGEKDGRDAFYNAFYKWMIHASGGNKIEQKKMKESIFPPIYKDWLQFQTIEDWKKEFDSHPEWSGLSSGELQFQDGGRGFYQAFNTWCLRIVGGDAIESQKLRNQVIGRKRKTRVSYTSVEDWKKEFDEHPEWAGLNTNDMQKRAGLAAKAFYVAFNKWVKHISGSDKKNQKLLTEKIFPAKLRDWSEFVTIQQWENLFFQWKGMSSSEVGKRLDEGGPGALSAFYKWVKNNSGGDIKKMNELKYRIFPPRKKRQYNFEGHTNVLFDSYPERLLGIILYDMGLITDMIEGTSLHVKTHDLKSNSIDFRVGDIFLEYHPVGPYEAKHNLTFSDTAKRKYVHITNPGMKGRTKLYVFDDVNVLFDIIKSDRELQFYIRNPLYRTKLEKEDWDDLVKEAYRKCIEFDTIHPRIKKKTTLS